MTYRVVSAEGPVELVVVGATLPELFEHAAMAVFDVAFELGRFRVERDVPLMAVGDSPEALLRDWLSELMRLADGHGLVVTTATVDRLEPGGVQGAFGGYRIGDAVSRLAWPVRAEPAGPIVEVPEGYWTRLAVSAGNSQGGLPS